LHDIAVVQSFLDAIVEKVEGRKVGSVKATLAIGALRFVENENVKFWMQEMLKKEFGESTKTEIKVETILPSIKCGCGFEGDVKDFEVTHDMAHLGIFEMHCPKCGGKNFEITKGRDCALTSLEIE